MTLDFCILVQVVAISNKAKGHPKVLLEVLIGIGVPTPKAQVDGAKGCGSIPPKCPTCGRNHGGECLRGSRSCFGYGKMGYKTSECPNIANNGKERH